MKMLENIFLGCKFVGVGIASAIFCSSVSSAESCSHSSGVSLVSSGSDLMLGVSSDSSGCPSIGPQSLCGTARSLS